MGHGYNVRLAWTGPTHLTIGYPHDANMLAWRKRFRTNLAGTLLDVELTPIDSKNGLFPGGENECVGGRPDKPLQPTSGAEVPS